MKFTLNVRKIEEDDLIIYKSIIGAGVDDGTQPQFILDIILPSPENKYCEECWYENLTNIKDMFAFMHKYGVEIYTGKECNYFYFYTEEIPDSAFSEEISEFHPTPIYLALDKITRHENLTENKENLRSQATYYWPQVSPSIEESDTDCFERILQDGLTLRYGKASLEVLARVKQEKAFIIKQGLQRCFLVWHDIVQHAKKIGCEIGPGRGCAVGSLVCYALGITKIEPIKHGLLFERFINDLHPISRIDVDVEMNRRNEICAYIQEKYGAEFVAKVSIYRTGKDGVQVKTVNSSIIVVSDTPIRTFVSTSRDSTGWLVTDLDAQGCERLGLLTLGVLSLSDITYVKNSVKVIRKTHPTFNLGNIDYDDKQTFDKIKNNELVGVFFLDGKCIRKNIREIQPNCFNDIVAICSMICSQLNEEYARNKKDPKNIIYLHPLLRPILEETYGILIYQEQVMRIFCEIGGFEMTEADYFRRILKTNLYNEIDLNLQKFVASAEKLDVTNEIAHKILDFVFLRLPTLFNKSHAVAYTKLTFQMAYISTYYPKEFYNTLLDKPFLSDEDRAIYESKLEHLGAK